MRIARAESNIAMGSVAASRWPLSAGNLPRPAFFAALVVIGFANGISENVYRTVADRGLWTAAFDTFGVSIVLWSACAAAVVALFRIRAEEELRRGDLVIATLAGLAFLLPVPHASWIGLCLIALHLHITASDRAARRAAAIVFALTIPLFWARLLFAAFSDAMLRSDARLVAWIVGTEPAGNVVPLADGSGSMFIAPACSSLANLSLAILSAAVFVNVRSGRWTSASVGWALASAALVVAINVTRIGLIGLYPSHFALIHGPVGAAIAGWLTLIVIIAIGYHRIGFDASCDR
jgi:hypothetical protein